MATIVPTVLCLPSRCQATASAILTCARALAQLWLAGSLQQQSPEQPQSRLNGAKKATEHEIFHQTLCAFPLAKPQVTKRGDKDTDPLCRCRAVKEFAQSYAVSQG